MINLVVPRRIAKQCYNKANLFHVNVLKKTRFCWSTTASYFSLRSLCSLPQSTQQHSKSGSDAFHYSSSVDKDEISKFSDWAEDWWDPNGPLKPLHQLNPIRVKYIKDRLIKSLELQRQTLQGLQVLDIGCGAGILSESLARLGASVTGIDAAENNIKVASLHAKRDPFLTTSKIQYIHDTAESLVEKNQSFDVVCALEVIEHVSDVNSFVINCTKLVKPGGFLFISTLNRTLKSYIFGIVAAEYILGLCGVGTHQWQKFVAPEELKELLQEMRWTVEDVSGMMYNPLTSFCSFTTDTSVNYIMCALKNIK